MIAPSNHFELFLAEIMKQESRGSNLVSAGYRGTLGWGNEKTDLLFLRFVDDQSRMVDFIEDLTHLASKLFGRPYSGRDRCKTVESVRSSSSGTLQVGQFCRCAQNVSSSWPLSSLSR
jgi:hypothetical protein